jgi:hypothetical protein
MRSLDMATVSKMLDDGQSRTIMLCARGARPQADIWGSVTREPHGGRTGPPFRLGYGRVCDRRAGGAPFHFGRAEKLRHPDHTWTFVKKECYDNRRLADLANRRLQRLGENDSGLMVRMLDTAIEDPAHPSACREICRGPVRSRDTTAAAAWYACGRCWME